jgi:hypothetical protein
MNELIFADVRVVPIGKLFEKCGWPPGWQWAR